MLTAESGQSFPQCRTQLFAPLAQIVFLVNFFYSLFFGPKAGRNPWHANTLEWTAPSPPPHGNFEQTPIVVRGPYEYASSESEEDYLPQTAPVQGTGVSTQPVHH